ncbi:MAG: alpha/beta hydrolase, partial [Mycobacterium sp.]
VELNGELGVATSVAVLVPGMNTTIEGSAANTRTARQLVSATRGEVAAITYLGGPFPQDSSMVGALVEAASPRFALDMAPRLVAFSRGVDATVDATGRAIPVTYVGHSYGGAILGTAEAMGLTADRTLYAAAAGAGFGVDGPEDWHNRNPDVLRFSMTAPGDPIQLVQGIPGGTHGADPDEMPGVIHLATGRYDDGRLMAGPRAHTDVVNAMGSDAWRNVLAVITGDRAHIVLAG